MNLIVTTILGAGAAGLVWQLLDNAGRDRARLMAQEARFRLHDVEPSLEIASRVVSRGVRRVRREAGSSLRKNIGFFLEGMGLVLGEYARQVGGATSRWLAEVEWRALRGIEAGRRAYDTKRKELEGIASQYRKV